MLPVAVNDRIIRIDNKKSLAIEALANSFNAKYGDLTRSAKESKLSKLQKKHKINDKDYQIIREYILQPDTATKLASVKVEKLSNKLSELLGNNLNSSTKISDDKNVSQIVSMAVSPLATTIFTQSQKYDSDKQKVALGGIYDSSKDDMSSYIHPIVVALFLNKNNLVEQRTLMTSLASLLNKRKDNMKINRFTRDEMNLFEDLITDRNDIVCDSSSVSGDYKARSEIQQLLWANVLKLRNGEYYDKVSQKLLAKLINCSLDGSHVGSINVLNDHAFMNKLLQVFSIKPIQMEVSPFMGSTIMQQDFNQLMPSTQRRNDLFMRLDAHDPSKNTLRHALAKQRTLQINPTNKVSLVQPNYIQVVENVTNVENLLVIHVDRSVDPAIANLRMELNDYYNQWKPRDYPDYVYGLQKYNNTVVEVEMAFPEYSLDLTAVICAKPLKLENEPVMINKMFPIRMGSLAYIKAGTDWYSYDPTDAVMYYNRSDGNKVDKHSTGPINIVNVNTVKAEIKQNGTIFIYTKSYTPSSLNYNYPTTLFAEQLNKTNQWVGNQEYTPLQQNTTPLPLKPEGSSNPEGSSKPEGTSKPDEEPRV